MSGSGEPRQRTASLQLHIGPIPVSIHVSSPIVLALLGPDLTDLPLLGVWVTVGIVSILVHELGHAVVVRRAGGEPRVELQWFGGLTSYEPNERLRSRRWSAAVSLAGPATGILTGLALLWLDGTVTITEPLLRSAVDFGYFVSFVWAVFNLLPLLPLDGGQAARALLPGTPAERTRRAAVLGVVAGVAVAAWAVSIDQVFVALFVGLLTWQNVRVLRSGGRSGRAEGASLPGLGAGGDDGSLEALRERARSGEAGRDELVEGVRRAARADDDIAVVELVNVALGQDVDDPRLPWQAARSWTALDQPDRAVRMVRTALELGAGDQRLAGDPRLRPLHDHPAWPLGTAAPDAEDTEDGG